MTYDLSQIDKYEKQINPAGSEKKPATPQDLAVAYRTLGTSSRNAEDAIISPLNSRYMLMKTIEKMGGNLDVDEVLNTVLKKGLADKLNQAIAKNDEVEVSEILKTLQTFPAAK